VAVVACQQTSENDDLFGGADAGGSASGSGGSSGTGTGGTGTTETGGTGNTGNTGTGGTGGIVAGTGGSSGTGTGGSSSGGCDPPCPSGVPCYASSCGCPDTLPLCDGQCRDTSVDPAHCGECNNPCASGVCENGACAPVIGELVGWAATAGRGLSTTTGGEGGEVVDVNSASELQNEASGTTRRIIRISGTITVGEVQVGSNKTLVGVGTNATIVGGISIDGESNVIVQNLHVNAKTSTAHGDGIHVEASHHVWVDHCDVWDAPDGLLDITHQSDLVTVSWTRFWYSSSPADNGHRFSVLLGADDADPDAGYLNVTFHHNWWAERVLERMPRVRFGKVHVFNNYFSSSGNNHCVRAAYQSNVLIENNYFDGVNNPHEINSDNNTAVVSAPPGNTYDGTSGTRTTRGTAFTPPYPYELQNASVINSAVPAGYGPR
jgi:pectate lyase